MREGGDSHSIRIYMREIGQVPLLTRDQEIDLARRVKNGDEEARHTMISANLRLVVKIAEDYLGLGVPLLDLVSEGNIGLTKAVERFDADRGNKFSTYAVWWIKQSIKRALANQGRTIRLPSHMVDKVYRMTNRSCEAMERFGREPTDDELAEEMGVRSMDVAHWKRVAARTVSLNAPLGDDDSGHLSDIIADASAGTPIDEIIHRELRVDVERMIMLLDHREQEILRRRYGLRGAKKETLEMVGRLFNVTHERVRQIQHAAVVKLWAMFEEEGAAPMGRNEQMPIREYDRNRNWT